MNLHALRIFKVVAEFESVTKAANYLCLSQPAVTIQIRHLEKELDVALLQTRGRGIQLTEIGKVLAKEADKLFSLEASIEEKIKDAKKQLTEKIVIASTYLPSSFLLPTYIAKFKAENSNTQIILQTGNSTDTIHKLLNYKADVGIIVSENINEPQLSIQHWKDIEFYFITHPEHALADQLVSIKDVVTYPFVLREKGSSTRELLEAICLTQGVPAPEEGLVFDGLMESVQAILSGYGIMLAPSIAVEQYLVSNQLRRIYINELQIMRPVYICTRQNNSPNANTETFINTLLM